LKNFNFAFFLALFAAINGWVALNTPENSNFIYISVIFTLPLLFLALNSLIKKPSGTDQASGDTADFDIISESMVPYITSLIATAAFTVFVYKTVSSGVNSAMFFVAPRIAGWTWISGVVSGMLCLLMGASGAGIWSAAYRQRIASNPSLGQSRAARAMLMGCSPGVRLAAYFGVLCATAAAAGIIVYIIFGGGRAHDWSGYVIVTGRSLLPAAVLLPAALLRIPILPMAILALAGCGALFGYNTSYIEGGVFAGAQLLIIAACSVMFSGTVKKGRGASGVPQQQNTVIEPIESEKPSNEMD